MTKDTKETIKDPKKKFLQGLESQLNNLKKGDIFTIELDLDGCFIHGRIPDCGDNPVVNQDLLDVLKSIKKKVNEQGAKLSINICSNPDIYRLDPIKQKVFEKLDEINEIVEDYILQTNFIKGLSGSNYCSINLYPKTPPHNEIISLDKSTFIFEDQNDTNISDVSEQNKIVELNIRLRLLTKFISEQETDPKKIGENFTVQKLLLEFLSKDKEHEEIKKFQEYLKNTANSEKFKTYFKNNVEQERQKTLLIDNDPRFLSDNKFLTLCPISAILKQEEPENYSFISNEERYNKITEINKKINNLTETLKQDKSLGKGFFDYFFQFRSTKKTQIEEENIKIEEENIKIEENISFSDLLSRLNSYGIESDVLEQSFSMYLELKHEGIKKLKDEIEARSYFNENFPYNPETQVYLPDLSQEIDKLSFKKNVANIEGDLGEEKEEEKEDNISNQSTTNEFDIKSEGFTQSKKEYKLDPEKEKYCFYHPILEVKYKNGNKVPVPNYSDKFDFAYKETPVKKDFTTQNPYEIIKSQVEEAINEAFSKSRYFSGCDEEIKKTFASFVILSANKNDGVGNKIGLFRKDLMQTYPNITDDTEIDDLCEIAKNFSFIFQNKMKKLSYYTGDVNATNIVGMRLKRVSPDIAQEICPDINNFHKIFNSLGGEEEIFKPNPTKSVSPTNSVQVNSNATIFHR